MAVQLLWARPVFWEVGACLGMCRSFYIWEAHFNIGIVWSFGCRKVGPPGTFGLDSQVSIWKLYTLPIDCYNTTDFAVIF